MAGSMDVAGLADPYLADLKRASLAGRAPACAATLRSTGTARSITAPAADELTGALAAFRQNAAFAPLRSRCKVQAPAVTPPFTRETTDPPVPSSCGAQSGIQVPDSSILASAKRRVA